jgi:exopolysaccharide/PEP-CTERM locus tyrosine autokinase
MSLVEHAIRKLQDRRAAEDAQSPQAVSLGQTDTLPQLLVPEPPVPARAPAPARAPEAATVDSAMRPGGMIKSQITLNMAALRNGGLLPPEHEERQLSRQYRQIKRPLIANALGRGGERVKDGQLIVVTSAMPGEGKTFTTLNLALSLALEKDLNLVLVDADVGKPHLSRLFGATQLPGLLDVLRQPELDVEDVILPTSVPKLSFLPVGRRSSEATELLSSDRMHQLVHALGSHDEQRLVVFDSPPLLLTTESHALTQAGGQIVVVVRAGATTHATLMDALTYVRDHPAVSLVLNQSKDPAQGYYYYGYGDSGSGAVPPNLD